MTATQAKTANAIGGTALPQRWPWLVRGFCKYARKYFAKNFHGVRIAKNARPPQNWNGPAIMVMNHPSWWDAMIGFLLLPMWPNRLDYAPMDAKQLNRYRVFAKLGMFGVEQDSVAGARNFLKVGRSILAHDNATLWITAQGEFSDVRTRPVTLRPGVGHLASSMEHGVIMPIAVEYPFWNESKPEALLAFGEVISVADHPHLNYESWTELIAKGLESAQDRLAMEAQSRDPQQFDTVLEGQSGVGGVYDMGRRMRSWMTGKRFRAEHSTPFADE